MVKGGLYYVYQCCICTILATCFNLLNLGSFCTVKRYLLVPASPPKL